MTHETVPVEPTAAMAQNALEVSRRNVACGMTRLLTEGCELWAASEVWRAMLEAAPPSPVTEMEKKLAFELISVLDWARVEKQPLRSQEIESIKRALAAYEAKKDTK